MSTKSRLLIVLGVVIVAGIALSLVRLGRPAAEVTVGSKHFTEQEVLGEMLAALIECSSDIKVARKLNLGGTMICFNALKAGDLDLYAEYTGTGLVNILKRDVISDPDAAYQVVKQAFAEDHEMVWLKPFGFNNTYTLTMRRDHAARLGIKSISDLAEYVQPEGMRAAFDAEFLTRPDGYPGLSKHYGFEFASEPMQMDPGLMYRAVADDAVDVIDGFATDGRIPAYDLLVLDDDKGFFPPYYAAPLVRAETLREHPEIEEILNRLAGNISDDAMQRLNYEVDEEGRKAAEVAREFLISQGLLAGDASPGDAREQ